MDQEELKKLWQELGDVPVNEEDEIEIEWHGWEKGTPKFDIWHWFDEKSNGTLPPR